MKSLSNSESVAMAASIFSSPMTRVGHGDVVDLALRAKNLPAQTVYEATGMQCAYYLENPSVRTLRKKTRKKRPGEVDVTG